MTKKILSVFLAAVMLFSAFTLSSCKPQVSPVDARPASNALTTKSLTNIYQAQAVSTLDTVFENVEINGIHKLAGGKLLVNCFTRDTYETKYYITDETFKEATEMPVIKAEGKGSDTYVNQIATDANGNIWYIKYVYTYNTGEDYPIADDDLTEMPVTYNGVFKSATVAVADIAVETMPIAPYESRETYYLVKVDAAGDIVSETDMTEMLKVTDEDGNSYSGYVNNIATASGKLVMNVNGQKITVIDSETGEVEKEIKAEVDYVESFFVSASGEVFFSSWGENGYDVYKLNLETEKAEKTEFITSETINQNLYSYSFAPGEFGYDFLMSDANALYGYSLGDAEPTEICNYTNSDISVTYSRSVPVVLGDGRLLMSYYDYDEQENVLLILNKVDPSQVKEKYIITVAGAYVGRDVKTAFMKFNRTSDEYKIVFKDYSKYNNESNEWRGAYDKLEQDIVSKNDAPDIILLSGIDYESLAAKGAFMDLNVFMDEDSEFDRSKYLENVFEALETRGSLYRISPTVNFYTLAGKKSIFGDKTSWTMKEFLEMHNSLGEDEQMFLEETRDGLGRTILSICVGEFIEDTGRCNFNSEEFKSILQYLKDIPADYTAYQDLWQENNRYWEEMELSYSKGTTKLYPTYVSNFNIIPQTEAYLGEEITFIGFPTSAKGNNGTIIYPNTIFAINSGSKVSAGAWKALKYLLSDEYQNKFSGDRNEDGSGDMQYQFPINKTIVEKRMKNDILPYYYTYTDENGELIKEEYGNTFWIGNAEVELRKSTQEDTQKLYELVTNASVVLDENQEVLDMILQEAQGYFDGAKGIDETANIINSRVQLLVNERM